MSTKLTVAIPKGRIGASAISLLNSIGLAEVISPKSRKLVFIDREDIRYLLVKSVDVITYVENGVADLGIIGSDNIMEKDSDVYELMDLGFGQCKFSIAGLENQSLDNPNKLIKIATKYPNVTKKYFRDKNQKIEIITLNGSVELAPLVGLSNVIVDIVETGNTLKANGLSVIEDMHEVSAKLIVNRGSYRFKSSIIEDIVRRLEVRLGD